MATALSAGRFAAPELLRLGRPPSLAAVPYQTLLDQTLTKAAEEFAAAGIDWDVRSVNGTPGVVLSRLATYRDELRRQAIDDAVAQGYLGSATGIWLELRANDYGVVRRSIPYTGNQSGTAEPLRPSTVPPLWTWDGAARAWKEDDESLRLRARLAWEALSVAGPAGAYVFHALEAHPNVKVAAVYGPETGIVEPGEVLVVVQASTSSGVPAQGTLDSVAARLDAHEVRYSTGATVFREVRDEQSIRPIGARVIVQAVEPVIFYVAAKLYVRPGPDPEVIRQEAIKRLNAYLESRRKIGFEVPVSAIIAALHVADASGLPVVEEVEISNPTADIVPAYNQLAIVSVTHIEIEVR